MSIYTVKLKRSPKEGETINIANGFKFSKMPTVLCAKKDNSSGRFLTGIDELDIAISSLPKDKQEKERERRKDLRLQLEEQTGLNLSATNNDYWHSLATELFDGRVYDTNSPKDRIAIEFLKRRGDVAFSRDEIWSPKCQDIEFYIETGEGAKQADSSIRRKKVRAIAELSKIMDNKESLFNVCYLLELAPKKEETPSELEDKLTLYIDSDEDNMNKFIDVAKMDKERLQNLILLKKAYKAKVIAYDVETKTFYRGNTNYKRTIEESVDYLMLPENMSEIEEIAVLVAKKEKGKTIYA